MQPGRQQCLGVDFEAEGSGRTPATRTPRGSGRLEQPPADGLSPWVLLAIIQQVFIGHLLGAWCCPGLSVCIWAKTCSMQQTSGSPGKGTLGHGEARAKARGRRS